jgi:hypothetical protein
MHRLFSNCTRIIFFIKRTFNGFGLNLSLSVGSTDPTIESSKESRNNPLMLPRLRGREPKTSVLARATAPWSRLSLSGSVSARGDRSGVSFYLDGQDGRGNGGQSPRNQRRKQCATSSSFLSSYWRRHFTLTTCLRTSNQGLQQQQQ